MRIWYDFINQVARLDHGRACFAEPEHLGEYNLADYVDRKRKTKTIR